MKNLILFTIMLIGYFVNAQTQSVEGYEATFFSYGDNNFAHLKFRSGADFDNRTYRLWCYPDNAVTSQVKYEATLERGTFRDGIITIDGISYNMVNTQYYWLDEFNGVPTDNTPSVYYRFMYGGSFVYPVNDDGSLDVGNRVLATEWHITHQYYRRTIVCDAAGAAAAATWVEGDNGRWSSPNFPGYTYRVEPGEVNSRVFVYNSAGIPVMNGVAHSASPARGWTATEAGHHGARTYIADIWY